MLGNFFTFRGIFTAILFITLGFSEVSVSLYIANVDIVAGTLDINMTNNSGCSYCSVSDYNNNTQIYLRKSYITS